jgi:collagen type I/II/III/V/XI/XXIV/XXVII alpha
MRALRTPPGLVKPAPASVPLAASVDAGGNLVFAAEAPHAPAPQPGSAHAGSAHAAHASSGFASPGQASAVPEPAGIPAEASPPAEVGLVGLSDHGGGGLHHLGFQT